MDGLLDSFRPENFFDVTGRPWARLFEGLKYVWEAVEELPGFIEDIIDPQILGDVEQGAWIEPGSVSLGEGSSVERGAIIRGPTIIGRNSTIRSGAYIRGHVLVGDDCLIGHGTEIRQTLIQNQSNVPHLNCIFTSLVGSRVNIGGATHTANMLLNRKEIKIRVQFEGKEVSFSTGLSLLGVVIGDDTSVGGVSLFQPGTIVGKRCIIHPYSTVSGYIPNDSIVRPQSRSLEVLPRQV